MVIYIGSVWESPEIAEGGCRARMTELVLESLTEGKAEEIFKTCGHGHRKDSKECPLTLRR